MFESEHKKLMMQTIEQSLRSLQKERQLNVSYNLILTLSENLANEIDFELQRNGFKILDHGEEDNE